MNDIRLDWHCWIVVFEDGDMLALVGIVVCLQVTFFKVFVKLCIISIKISDIDTSVYLVMTGFGGVIVGRRCWITGPLYFFKI